MSIIDFILLRAIFNEQLHNAVLAKNKADINRIIQARYADELNDGFVKGDLDFDIEEVYNKHVEQLENDNFEWAK